MNRKVLLQLFEMKENSAVDSEIEDFVYKLCLKKLRMFQRCLQSSRYKWLLLTWFGHSFSLLYCSETKDHTDWHRQFILNLFARRFTCWTHGHQHLINFKSHQLEYLSSILWLRRTEKLLNIQTVWISRKVQLLLYCNSSKWRKIKILMMIRKLKTFV